MNPYRTAQYKQAKAELKGQPCWKCGTPANSVDHVPPLTHQPPGEWQGQLLPCCLPCNTSHGARIGNQQRNARRQAAREDTPRSPMWQ